MTDDSARRGEAKPPKCICQGWPYGNPTCTVHPLSQPAAQEAERAFEEWHARCCKDCDERCQHKEWEREAHERGRAEEGEKWSRVCASTRERLAAAEQEIEIQKALFGGVEIERDAALRKLAAAEAQSEQLQHLFDECYADKCAAVKAGMAAEKRAAAASGKLDALMAVHIEKVKQLEDKLASAEEVNLEAARQINERAVREKRLLRKLDLIFETWPWVRKDLAKIEHERALAEGEK